MALDRRFFTSVTIKKQARSAMKPMISADIGVTKPAAGVIPTNPRDSSRDRAENRWFALPEPFSQHPAQGACVNNYLMSATEIHHTVRYATA
jgi:hypothetical protein